LESVWFPSATENPVDGFSWVDLRDICIQIVEAPMRGVDITIILVNNEVWVGRKDMPESAERAQF
jgi:hypothetical protein